ncbi:MAG: FGGY-family carbohydrate kinase [Paracoccaceae bacterium]
MSSSENKAFVPGVWGPYFSAMVPGRWLSESGQSAAGEAIAHLLKLHPSHDLFATEAEKSGQSLPDYLLSQLEKRVPSASDAVHLANQIVVVPEFLGNRAPFADPKACAVISGLDLSTDLDSLLALYVAGLFGLGYGLKQILDVQRDHDVCPDTVVISGGAGEHPIVKQLLADAAGIRIARPDRRNLFCWGLQCLARLRADLLDRLKTLCQQCSAWAMSLNLPPKQLHLRTQNSLLCFRPCNPQGAL